MKLIRKFTMGTYRADGRGTTHAQRLEYVNFDHAFDEMPWVSIWPLGECWAEALQ